VICVGTKRTVRIHKKKKKKQRPLEEYEEPERKANDFNSATLRVNKNHPDIIPNYLET